MANENGKVVKSLFWSILERIGSQGVGLIVSIVLARLILPEEYGIISAAHILTGIATTFVSGGFGNALIQKKDADDKDYSTMFVFNMVFSLLVYVAIYLIAPYAVLLFDVSFEYELLVKVIRVLGIGVVLASFNSFYRAILTKQLLFKNLFKLTLIGTVCSACVGIFMAYRGFGVWALVTQNLFSYAFNTILFIASSKWKPKVYFSFSRFRPMFSYGLKLMLSGLLITAYADITSLVIGNRYSSENLAYYNKGINFPKLLVLNIITAINTTLFPIMSNINDADKLKELTRKFNRISAFIITPMMLGFAAVGPSFIKLMLTDKWLPSVVFLQISCLNYAIQPLGMSSLQYLKASGKATTYLVLDIIRKIVGIVLLIIAVFTGKDVIWIAFSEVLSNFIAIFINMYPGKKYLGYLIREQILDVLPKFVLSIVMFIVVYSLNYLPVSNFLLLILQITVGVFIYFLGAKLFRMKELDELMTTTRNFTKKSHD